MKLAKHTRTFLVTATVIGFLLSGVISCRRSKDSETSTGKLSPEEKKALSALVKARAEYHNAVEVRSESLRGYTIEVQEALIRSDGRPVLVYATVQDIAKRHGKYFVYFRPCESSYLLSLLHDHTGDFCILECSPDQVKEIMQRERSESQSASQEDNSLSRISIKNYAIIARFSSVQKPMFCVTAQEISGVEADIVVESPEVIVALGRCLDLVFLGSYNPLQDL